jgi:hypothetical protein
VSDQGTAAIEVIVKLTREAAVPESRQHRALQALVAELGVPLAPLHPSATDPDLASYAVAQVDPVAANSVVEQLRRCDGVEGAYAKPQGEPPEGRADHA